MTVRSLGQFCGMARAFEIIGPRWSALIIRDLVLGPKRFTDLHETLPRITEGILHERLGELESAGVIRRSDAESDVVYELTDYGRALRPALRELALWGARSLGPPTDQDELFTGWLQNAIDIVLAPLAPPGRFEFRIGDEVASLIDGEAYPGPADNPDVVVEAGLDGLYQLLVERRLDLVSIQGDNALLEQLLATTPQAPDVPAPA